MPSAVRYVTKDSHPTLRTLAEEKSSQPIQGRRYTHAYAATQPGAVQAKEMSLGMQYACLSITDDEPDTLKNVAKANPWQLHCMTTLICDGNEEEALLPLSTLLRTRYDLTLDHCMNISGVSKAGHALDTQGYIAHNDTTIVLAYRCTTSAKDWITNLTTTSSAWEIDLDVPHGHSGYFSSCVGYGCFPCTSPDKRALNYAPPRVHTGFYNNFLVTVPLIEKFIDPLLLDPSQPPRTLYVVGHSLGAGIAIMAACYFVMEDKKYDWRKLSSKLRVVTAGGPRACCQSMQQQMDAKCKHDYRYTDKVVISRLVRDKDVVPTVPPELFGFRHLNEKLVYITKEDAATGFGQVIINPNAKQVLSKRQLHTLKEQQPEVLGLQANAHPMPNVATESSDDEDEDDEDDDIDGGLAKAVQYVVAPTCLSPHDTATNGSDEMEVYAVEHGPKTTKAPDVAVTTVPSTTASSLATDPNDSASTAAAKKVAQYEKFVKCVPRPFRDHMPDYYLKPLLHLQQEQEQHVRMASSVKPVSISKTAGAAAPTTTTTPIHTTGNSRHVGIPKLISNDASETSKQQPDYDSIVDETESRGSSVAIDYQPLHSQGSSFSHEKRQQQQQPPETAKQPKSAAPKPQRAAAAGGMGRLFRKKAAAQ